MGGAPILVAKVDIELLLVIVALSFKATSLSK